MRNSAANPSPFTLRIADGVLADLRKRLARIRWPMGYAEFLRPPRSVAARMYSDIRRWTTQPKGGHFAAMEQPEALAHEIREFFRPLRARR